MTNNMKLFDLKLYTRYRRISPGQTVVIYPFQRHLYPHLMTKKEIKDRGWKLSKGQLPCACTYEGERTIVWLFDFNQCKCETEFSALRPDSAVLGGRPPKELSPAPGDVVLGGV